MLQLDSLRTATGSDYVSVGVSGNQGNSGVPSQSTGQNEGVCLPLAPDATYPGGMPGLHSAHGLGTMVHWSTGFPQPQQPQPQQHQQQHLRQHPTGILHHSDDEDDDEYRPFTPPPPRERLSYTRYQLELLNGIYQEVRYPNSTQKQLIAKRVGITREQVKIWFQNRRRKDVVTKVTTDKSDSKDGISSDKTNSPATSASNDNSNQMDESNFTSTTSTTSDGAAAITTTASSSTANSVETIGGTNQSERAPCSSHGSSDPENPDSQKSKCNSSDNTASTNTLSAEPVRTSGSGGESSSNPPSTPPTSSSASASNQLMVSLVVLRSIVAELNKFDNEYLKQKKTKKKSKSKSSRYHSSATSSTSSLSSGSLATLTPCKAQRLFQSYDMVAPPNKVTPTAILNTSANRFKHAGGTSAFQNPREHRLLSSGLPSNESFVGYPILTPAAGGCTAMDAPDLLQQRSPTDLMSVSLASPLGVGSLTSHNQPGLAGLFTSPASSSGTHALSSQPAMYDNLPVLTDLLGSYKNHASNVAAAAAQRQLDHSFLSSCSPPGQPSPSAPGSRLFNFMSSSVPTSLGGGGGSSSNNSMSSESLKSPGSDMLYPPSPTHHPHSFSLHPHHASPFALNRVFPFPLIADPPMMLSSLRQTDPFRSHQAQWPPPPSPIRHQTSPQSSVFTGSIPSSATDDPYRPLMISSLSNPYFSPSSSVYSLTPTALPPPPLPWPSSPPGSDPNNNYTQL